MLMKSLSQGIVPHSMLTDELSHYLMHRSINQKINQSTNQSRNQSIHPSIHLPMSIYLHETHVTYLSMKQVEIPRLVQWHQNLTGLLLLLFWKF